MKFLKCQGSQVLKSKASQLQKGLEFCFSNSRIQSLEFKVSQIQSFRIHSIESVLNSKGLELLEKVPKFRVFNFHFFSHFWSIFMHISLISITKLGGNVCKMKVKNVITMSITLANLFRSWRSCTKVNPRFYVNSIGRLITCLPLV